jgi:hypothetical protein
MKTVTTAEILARKALERPCGAECVSWAIEQIEAGQDSKSLYVLAGLSGPLNHFEVAQLRDRVLAELDIPEDVQADPISAYVGELVQSALRSDRSLREVFSEITTLSIELGYPSELQAFYNLHFAAEDLSYSEDQWYWIGATRENIDRVMLEQAESFVSRRRASLGAAPG